MANKIYAEILEIDLKYIVSRTSTTMDGQRLKAVLRCDLTTEDDTTCMIGASNLHGGITTLALQGF